MKKTIIFSIALILVFSFSALVYAASSPKGEMGTATETDCLSICNTGDYDSAYKCFKGTRSNADAALVTSHCALNAGDRSEAEKYALMSAKKRHEWLTLVTKFFKVKIKTGGTAESYMTAYVATGKETYKSKSIEFAMTSGQCIDITDYDKRKTCAEGYFNSYTKRLESGTFVSGRNTNPELAQMRNCPDAKTQYYSFLTGKCKCRKGFAQLGEDCVLDIYKKANIDLENAVELEDTFNNMKPTEVKVVKVQPYKKQTMKIAMAKKSDGSPMFSADGKKWYPELKKITNRDWKDSASAAWEWTSNLNPVNWFHTKWKDKDKELKWEIGETILKEFKDESKDPATYEEQFADEVQWAIENGQWAGELVNDMIDKGFLDPVKDASYASVLGKLKSYFIAFPAASVTKLAEELSADDFFQGVYYYIREREAGRTQEQIMKNQPEEMEFSVSVGTVESFGQKTYFNKLEEAYQRYRAYQELNKK
ncbi:hypothetical protein JXB41_08680 [Candidatus Woesearchaeota archaeon]|nr:hypothetical protein [Candidatus Woesearchaeota archaeon]